MDHFDPYRTKGPSEIVLTGLSFSFGPNDNLSQKAQPREQLRHDQNLRFGLQFSNLLCTVLFQKYSNQRENTSKIPSNRDMLQCAWYACMTPRPIFMNSQCCVSFQCLLIRRCQGSRQLLRVEARGGPEAKRWRCSAGPSTGYLFDSDSLSILG